MSHVSCVHRWRMSALALLGVSVACGEAPATPRELEEYRLEPLTKQYFDEFHTCPDCKHIYWKGSHYEHMQEMIRALG